MKKLYILSFLLIVLTSFEIHSQIINIPADYPTIQQGIDASQDGDSVLVQPGMYVEQINYEGKYITLGSLYLTTGNEDYIEQTIIDGDAYGLPCVQIALELGGTNQAHLIGLTIQNGWTGSDAYPAGILVGGNAVLDHLIIKDNVGACGGVMCFEGNSIIKNSKFINNTSVHYGGGLGISSINTVVINCVFKGNHAVDGSAVYIVNGGGTLINCLIFENSGPGDGIGNMAVEINGGGNISIINTTISNNNTVTGIYLIGGAPRIINSIISGHSGNNIKITGGGPLCIDNSIVEYGLDSVSLIYPAQIHWGDNNLATNPNFENPGIGNYHLNDCSQGIGAGIDSLYLFEQWIYSPKYDLDNLVRPSPAGTSPDIGAYENSLGIPLIPPSITLQPVGNSKCEGESYALQVEATGSPVIHYQWQKNNVDIPEETNTILILNNLIATDEGNYRCLVTNSCETKYSIQAFVEVKEAPDVNVQPQNQVVYFGNTTQFSVGANGDEPLSYQWYGPSGLMANDTLSQLQITGVSAGDVGNYYCTITNVCGSATSDFAILTAYEQLTVNAGEDVSVILGDSTQLIGSYTGGSPSLVIQWSPDSLLYDPNILNPQTVALLSSQAFTLTVNDLLVGYQTSDEVFVTVIEDDTLGYGGGYDTLYQYFNPSFCGYVSGNNCELDKIKANYFTDEMKSYNVEKVLLQFGKAVKTSLDEVPVKIGIWKKSTENDEPGELVDYANVPLSQIVQDVSDGKLTTVDFSTPVALSKDFFVGMFLPTTAGDTLALMTTIDGKSVSGMGWTLTASNEWISYPSDPRFFLRLSNAIFPVVKQNNVGINDDIIGSGSLRIYPNPAHDVLNIQFEENDVIAELRIYDIQGKTMICEQIRQVKASLDIGNLNPGVYIIRVEYDRQLLTRKLIVY